jgi:hypothetical protein
MMMISPILTIPHSIPSTLLAYAYAFIVSTTGIATTVPSSTTTTTTIFEFGNVGSSTVRVDNPLQFRSELLPPFNKNSDNHNIIKYDSGMMTLIDPQFLGAGGGGAVFSYSFQQSPPQQQKGRPTTTTMGDTTTTLTRIGISGGIENMKKGRNTDQNYDGSNNNNNSHKNDLDHNVIIKYSWNKSSDSVRNECTVLRVMEQRGIQQGVERCLGIMTYPDDPKRVMIAMQPVLVNSVSISSSTLDDMSSFSRSRSSSISSNPIDDTDDSDKDCYDPHEGYGTNACRGDRYYRHPTIVFIIDW